MIEMSAASGLPLVPEDKRNPMNTTSFGTGELILHALDKGYRKLYIAIGGSATNDGGMGCARALGARFLDRNGNELVGSGRDLMRNHQLSWICLSYGDFWVIESSLGSTSVSSLRINILNISTSNMMMSGQNRN